MKTSDRKEIQTVAERMTRQGHPDIEVPNRDEYRKMNARELKSLARTMELIAHFFEAHPAKWTKETYCTVETRQMCNMGLLYHGKEVVGFKTPSKTAISLADAYSDFLVGLNDSSSKLATNVEGLRLSATALRFAAAGVPFEKAVRKAFANNAHLLQVQTARKKKKVAAEKATRLAALAYAVI